MKTKIAGIAATGILSLAMLFGNALAADNEPTMSDAKGCMDRLLSAAMDKAQEENAPVSIQRDKLQILKEACLKKFPGTSLGYYEHMSEMTVAPPAPLGVPQRDMQSKPT